MLAMNLTDCSATLAKSGIDESAMAFKVRGRVL